MENLDAISSDIHAAIESGKSQIQQFEHEGDTVLVIPEGHKPHTLAAFLAAPKLLKQAITVLTPNALLDYWEKFATDHSVMFVDVQNGKFHVVLDYHQSPESPAWGYHTVTYQCPQTPEWKKWTHFSGEKMNQVQFAFFIEENAPEIIAPSSAEMLEVATTLQAKNKVSFTSAIKLENGETQFQYVENMDEKAGSNGQLTVPSLIKLAVKPLQGEPAYSMEARFRYRIDKEGGLLMWYDLIRPERIFEDAVNDVMARIKGGIKGGLLIEAIAPR